MVTASRSNARGAVNIYHLGMIVTIVAVLVGLFTALDVRSDAKVERSARQIRQDVIKPVVERMDRMEARQRETNGLLRNLLAEARK